MQRDVWRKKGGVVLGERGHFPLPVCIDKDGLKWTD